MSDRYHPIGSDGCTCRLHFYERPGSAPGVATAYGPDCPHHRPAEVASIGATTIVRDARKPDATAWRPTDSDS